MQDNLAGQVTILKSQLEELAISFSDILMPTIRSIVSRIQELVDKLNQLDPQTKETIAKIALMAAALGPMLILQVHPWQVQSDGDACRNGKDKCHTGRTAKAFGCNEQSDFGTANQGG